MAIAAAFPILEGVGVRLLAALVGAAAGAKAGDVIKERREKAQGAKESSVAQADTTAKSKERCKECPPDAGVLVTRKWNMSEESREYQARVTGFAPYTEWSFMGIDFDGFKSAQCLLQEAKGRYDQFFDPEDGQPKFFFRIAGAPGIVQQARKQSFVVASSSPARASWHFMQPLSYRYFSRIFASQFPNLTVLLQP